jgi:hypothetical protein
MASLFLIEAQKTYSYNQTLDAIPTIAISITPTPTPTTTTVNSEMISPDGSKLLTLTAAIKSEHITNTISVLNNEDIGTEVVEITPSVSEEFQIPFNTWSPDIFYFFMKTDDEYYVFQGSGEAFPTGEEYVMINSLFKEKMSDYSIDEVTGWADNTLLLVNARSGTGEKVSFWFDVPSRSFIQLGNYFE